jgi:hypothetical protein
MSTVFQNTPNRDSTFCAHFTTIYTPLSSLLASVLPLRDTDPLIFWVEWLSPDFPVFITLQLPVRASYPCNERSPLQLISLSHVFCFAKVSCSEISTYRSRSKQEVNEAAVTKIEVWSILTCFLQIISTQKKFRKKSNLRSTLNWLALWRLRLKNISCGFRLCGLVFRVAGYRFRGSGFDSRPYKIFWEVVKDR